MKILRLKEISKEFDGNIALQDVSLEINRGEVFFVIGPNGAGKTTLLRIMALLENPDAGEMFYKGVKVRNSDRLRKKITMVFQKPVFFNTTVFENVAYGLRLRGHSENIVRKKVRKTLSLVNLEGFENRRVKKLSGGEQQRVMLARALALDPEVLLLDEPTANLDPVNSKIVRSVIKELRGKTTVIVASHHFAQAKFLSDRVVCIYEGKVLEVGKTKRIFTHPKNEVTRKFLQGELI